MKPRIFDALQTLKRFMVNIQVVLFFLCLLKKNQGCYKPYASYHVIGHTVSVDEL